MSLMKAGSVFGPSNNTLKDGAAREHRSSIRRPKSVKEDQATLSKASQDQSGSGLNDFEFICLDDQYKEGMGILKKKLFN